MNKEEVNRKLENKIIELNKEKLETEFGVEIITYVLLIPIVSFLLGILSNFYSSWYFPYIFLSIFILLLIFSALKISKTIDNFFDKLEESNNKKGGELL